MAVKTSILVFYLTLTRNQKVFRWANYITLAVVNIAGFALTMVFVFQCRPVSAAFHSTVRPGAQCIDIVTLYLSSSPVNIITDLAIIFLPIPILTQMRLPYKQKVILVITFSFGFFVAVVDVIRVAFLQQAAISRSLALGSIHLQNNTGADFSCMNQSFYAIICISLTETAPQGMPRSHSCGPSSKSTSRLFAAVFPVSSRSSLASCQNLSGILTTPTLLETPTQPVKVQSRYLLLPYCQVLSTPRPQYPHRTAMEASHQKHGVAAQLPVGRAGRAQTRRWVFLTSWASLEMLRSAPILKATHTRPHHIHPISHSSISST